MTGMTYRSVYTQEGRYDQLLLPHFFGTGTDVDLVAARVGRLYDDPVTAELSVCDLGCGTGRVTSALAPYAAKLTGVDSSPAMTDAFRLNFPESTTICADLPDAVSSLPPGSFDIVGAFWSLSYPIMAYFEQINDRRITQNGDPGRAMFAARKLIEDIVSLLVPGGHLLVLFFDSASAEQQVVSRLWERLAPHPGGDRSFSRRILADRLHLAAKAGGGTFRIEHHRGFALARDANSARNWFLHVHAKSHPAILDDPVALREIDDFITNHRKEDGSIPLPAGVYLLDFAAAEVTND